jgi:hypothetical protein
MELKKKRGRISEYVEKYPNAKYFDGARPWEVKCDIALPCATQNELNETKQMHLFLTVVFVCRRITYLQLQAVVFRMQNYYLLQEKHLMLVV